jgi:hypothetical protein
MESSTPRHDADWTPPRFDLGSPVEDRPAPAQPAPAAAAPRRHPARRPAAPRAAAARRNGAPHRNSATLLALVFLLVAASGLIALVAMVMPLILWLVAVVLGFIALGAFHYLLWGWWAASAADVSGPPDDVVPTTETES